jgi:predicted flap endonuclease-1-like 5' DNA nuclease
MENLENKIFAIVSSPSRDAHLRRGRGFSLAEIKIANKSVALLKELKVSIDYFRRTAHKENIEKLKTLKTPEKKGKKKKPYIPKEKRVTVKAKAKKKITPPKKEEIMPEKPVEEVKPKAKAASTKKQKAKVKAEEKVEEKAEIKGIPLIELSGLGAATVKKFKEVGVENIEQLCKEKPEELSMLISGCSEERIRKWIEEGNKMLNK